MNLSVAQRWQVAAIILVGLNLRPVLASVPPLLDALQAATGMSDGAAGLMTALPVFVMGIGALSAAPLRRLLGERLGVLLGLAVIAIAAGARLAADHTGALLATGVAAGLGIAIAQALLPGYIKARLAAASSGVMGLYSTAIMGGAAIASVATPLMARQQSLSLSLAAWALPALVALACWARAAGRAEAVAHAAGADGAHGRRAWLLAIFFGLGTGAYTLVLAWLPPYYTALGWTPVAAGSLLGAVTVAEIAAGLLVSALIGRLPDRRPALYLAIGSLLVGLAGLAIAPLAFAWPASVLAGLGIGALFPLSLIVTMDHAATPAQAGRLAAFVQGVGYLIAATFPYAAGLIRQHVSDLRPAWGVMMAICAILFGMALRFRPQAGRR